MQSFRTEDVPDWVRCCLASVEAWARARDHPYIFIDDALFARVPGWYRAKVDDAVLPMSDLARLLVLCEFSTEYPSVAWLDADVLVFDPSRFCLPEVAYAVCPERWVFRNKAGDLGAVEQVNNSAMLFARENPFLAFYIEATESTVRAAEEPVASHLAGTDLLTRLDRVVPLAKLDGVGMISPALARDLAAGRDEAPRFYAEGLARPVQAANLCHSFTVRADPGQRLTAATIEAAIDRLLATKGGAINRWLSGQRRKVATSST